MNKVVDKYNNTYHRFIGKKSVDANFSVLTKEIEANPKLPKFKIGDTVRITKHKDKSTLKIGQNKYL